MAPSHSIQFIIVAILILLPIAAIFLWAFYTDAVQETRCPNCGNARAARYVREELVGVFKRSERRMLSSKYGNRSSDYKMVPYEKFKIHYRCEDCGHEWALTTTRKQ